MRSKVGNAIAVLALLITAWASLATSSSTSNMVDATLYVISDCVTPTLEQQVRVSNGTIVSGTNYTTFGFPLSTVQVPNDVTGPYNNGTATVMRTCVHTYGDRSTQSNDRVVYSCLDNQEYSCSIMLIKL